MDNLGYLGIAYGIAWAIIGGYLLFLARRQRAIEKRLDEAQTHTRQTDS